MEIQRVNPGQAGAIGVPVRVARSNAGEVLNAAANAANARAHGEASLIGALGNLGGAVSNFAAGKSKIALQDASAQGDVLLRMQALEKRKREADLNTDTALAVAHYEGVLGALGVKAKALYGTDDDAEFVVKLRNMTEEAQNEEEKSSFAPTTIDGKPNAESNGIGVRNATDPETIAKMKSALSLSSERFIAQHVKERESYKLNTAIGKAQTVLEDFTNTYTDRNFYTGAVDSLLEGYLTSSEREKIVDGFWKKASLKRFDAELSSGLAVAENEFSRIFEENISYGATVDYARTVALEKAEKVLSGSISKIEIPEFDGKKAIEDSFINKMKQEASRRLQDTARKQKDESNHLLTEDLKVLVNNNGSYAFEETKKFSDILSSDSVYGNSEEVEKILSDGNTNGVIGFSYNSGKAYTMLSNDLALLDLETADGRTKALKILNTARVLDVASFDAIKEQFKKQVEAIGKERMSVTEMKPLLINFLKQQGIDYTGKDSDSPSVKSLAATCLRYARANPLQWEQQVQNVIKEWRDTEAVRESSSGIGSAIVDTFFNSDTGIKYLKSSKTFPANSNREVKQKPPNEFVNPPIRNHGLGGENLLDIFNLFK